MDSLQTHLIKKCVGLSMEQKRAALLALNNIPSSADASRRGQAQVNGSSANIPSQNWTALETLAEVSRQMVTSETHDEHGIASRTPEPTRDRLELQEQYTLDNPPVSYEQRVQRDKKCKFKSYLYSKMF